MCIRDRLKFFPKNTIKEGINDLKIAFEKKQLKDSLNNPLYFNIQRMKQINLK